MDYYVDKIERVEFSREIPNFHRSVVEMTNLPMKTIIVKMTIFHFKY